MSELDLSDNPAEGLGEFYEYLWGDSEGWVYLPAKNLETEEWKKTLFEWPKHKSAIVKHTLARAAEGWDVYVAPAMFTEPSPIKDNVKGTNFLWVEFDGNAPVEWGPTPDSLPDAPRVAPEPSLTVQSSTEGHTHCYWKLADFETDTQFIENTNRALAYAYKADTSGWDIGQVLRPPFTVNHKHDLPVFVRTQTDAKHTKSAFKDFKAVKQVVKESIEINDIPPVTRVVAKYVFDDHHYDLFMKPSIEQGKRSSALMALGYFGAESGMTDEEIYSLLLNADDRWKKFTRREDRERRLLDIINRARQKHPVGLKSEEGLLRGLLGDDTNVETATKYVFGFREFNDTDIQIEWVFNGLLEKAGMGVLVSGPGVGKTQVSLQLAAACVLGTSFLKWESAGKFRILWFSLEMNHAALKHFTTNMAGGFTESEIEELDRHLKIVPLGEPLPLDRPEGRVFLETLLEEYKPDGIVIDSMSKVSNGSLSDEERIKSLNAFYAGIRNKYGCFIWFIHHNRKANSENKKPTTLDDVYGNQFIAAETSVALNLWKTTDRNIEVTELKNRLSPQHEPFKIKRTDHLKFEVMAPAINLEGLVNDNEPKPEPEQKDPPDPGILAI